MAVTIDWRFGAAGLPVPESMLVSHSSELDNARLFEAELGLGKVLVKPNRGAYGRGVSKPKSEKREARSEKLSMKPLQTSCLLVIRQLYSATLKRSSKVYLHFASLFMKCAIIATDLLCAGNYRGGRRGQERNTDCLSD